MHNTLSEDKTRIIQPIFSTKSAVGLVIAHGEASVEISEKYFDPSLVSFLGTVGKFLEVANSHLFISRNGGLSWKAVMDIL